MTEEHHHSALEQQLHDAKRDVARLSIVVGAIIVQVCVSFIVQALKDVLPEPCPLSHRLAIFGLLETTYAVVVTGLRKLYPTEGPVVMALSCSGSVGLLAIAAALELRAFM